MSSLPHKENELEKKRKYLAKLETSLAENETLLESLKCQLKVFEQLYQRTVGVRYLELDQIEAQISEYQALLDSHLSFNPSESLKQLYRSIAKKIHPDLANSESDAALRHEFMAKANQAYETGNQQELLNLLKDWESQKEPTNANQLEIELTTIERKIARARRRLNAIRSEQISLEKQDMYRLMLRVNSEKRLGRDILREMANTLDQKIADSKESLEFLKDKLSQKQNS